MRFIEKLCCISVLASVGLLTVGNTVWSQDVSKQLQKKLDEIVEEHSFPGATLGVVLPTGKTISLASGFEDPETKSKLAPNSRMFCGSTGKTFVSAVVLILASEDKIDLDDKVANHFSKNEDKWFYDLPNSQTMKIVNLLNHTSGLPRYIFQPEFLADLKKNPLKPRSPVECLSVLQNTTARNEPGKGWSYSDSNYLLLGLIVERITMKSFYDNVEARILRPLNLKNTLPATQPKIKGLVQGHIGRINPFGLPAKTVTDGQYALNPKFEWCGGGFVTTSQDLAVWMNALHRGNVLNKESYRRLTEVAPFETGLPGKAKYGLGTFVWETQNGKFFGHAGVMPGYLTQIEHSTKHGFSVAFQTNTDEGFGRHHHEIVQAFSNLIISQLEKK